MIMKAVNNDKFSLFHNKSMKQIKQNLLTIQLIIYSNSIIQKINLFNITKINKKDQRIPKSLSAFVA